MEVWKESWFLSRKPRRTKPVPGLDFGSFVHFLLEGKVQAGSSWNHYPLSLTCKQDFLVPDESHEVTSYLLFLCLSARSTKQTCRPGLMPGSRHPSLQTEAKVCLASDSNLNFTNAFNVWLDRLWPLWDLFVAFKCAVTCSWCSKPRIIWCFCVFGVAAGNCLDLQSAVRLSCSQFCWYIQSILSDRTMPDLRAKLQMKIDRLFKIVSDILKLPWGFKVPVWLQTHNKALRVPPKVSAGSTMREISTPDLCDLSDDEVSLLSAVCWMTGMCLRMKRKNILAVQLGRISLWRCWTFLQQWRRPSSVFCPVFGSHPRSEPPPRANLSLQSTKSPAHFLR